VPKSVPIFETLNVRILGYRANQEETKIKLNRRPLTIYKHRAQIVISALSAQISLPRTNSRKRFH